jgi:hypothetical protein
MRVQARERLDLPKGREQIFAWVKEHELDVLIIDTLRRVHLLKENEADDMAKIEQAVTELQTRSREELDRKLTIILLHHSPKPRSGGGGSAPETMARGSSDIIASVDGALYLTAQGHEIQVDHAKTRWSAHLEPFRVRFDSTPASLRLSYVGAAPTKRGRGDELRDWIRKTLASAPDRQLNQTEILAAASVSKLSNDKAIRTELAAMVKDSDLAIKQSGKFKVYTLVWSPQDEVDY